MIEPTRPQVVIESIGKALARVPAANDGRRALRLIACPHLGIDKDRIDQYVPAGRSITQHLADLGWRRDNLHARVTIDGRLIPEAEWEYVVPQAGQAVVLRRIPLGGGEGGKTALRIVGMLAVVLTSIYTGGLVGATVGGWFGVSAATGAHLVAAGLTIVGQLAMTAKIPPPLPRLAERSFNV